MVERDRLVLELKNNVRATKHSVNLDKSNEEEIDINKPKPTKNAVNMFRMP